jgi:hypothetical protein
MKDYTKDSVPDFTGSGENAGKIVSGLHAGKNYSDLEDEQKADLASSDADTLKKHAEIHQHPPRLKAAMQNLHGQKQAINTAHSHARRSLYNKTGQRLKEVYGEFGDESESE